MNLAKREKRPSSQINDIERFEFNNKVKLNIGRKTLTFKFKKISDLKRFIKEHFINDGFKDCIVLNDDKKQLEDVLNKYI